MRRAVFPGSFDPVTLGHLHLIERASRLYDEVIVVIGANSQKNALFSVEERRALLTECLRSAANVRVDVAEGLLVDKVKELGADVMLRGVVTFRILRMKSRLPGQIMSLIPALRLSVCLRMRNTVRCPARSSVSLQAMAKMYRSMCLKMSPGPYAANIRTDTVTERKTTVSVWKNGRLPRRKKWKKQCMTG